MNIVKHIAALLFVCASMAAFAQEASEKAVPEKIAIYAFGASDAGINKSLSNKLLSELVQSGMYAEIADHYAFQDELAKSGNNGIGNVTQTAKRHGADLVCAMNIVEVFGSHSITASMAKTSDLQVVKTVSVDRALKSLDDLTAASRELAVQFLNQPSAETAMEPATANSWIKFQPETVTSLAAALPAMSVAQALGSTSLSKGCVEDFTNVFGKSGFNIGNFAKELVTAVAKTKLQLKAPFGKPKDSDMTSAGLTVGCIKTLPESPAELQSLLKDIALKAGLDFAAGAAADLARNASDEEEDEEKDKSTVSFGIRGGINASHFYAEYNIGSESFKGSYNDAVGFQLGMVLDIAASDWFHIQPGIMYILKGTDNYYGEVYTQNYIELPLLVSLKFSALRINAGPYYGICIDASNIDFYSNDFGISMGFGFDISKFYIGMFYDYGLTSISSMENFDAYNRTIGLNIGVNL